MGRRKSDMPFHPDVVRKRIQAAKLVDRLQDHIFDRLPKPLDISQVRAIDLLLKKCIPDLTRTLISADVNVKYVAELPKVLTKSEWIAKYGDGAKLIEGIVDGQENGSTDGTPADKILQ